MGKLKVKAISGGDIKWAGYYDLQRRKPGEEFILNSEKEFSPLWMEAIGWSPAPMSSQQKAAQKEIIRQDRSALDIRKELEARGKMNKVSKVTVEKPVPAAVVEVNTEDKSPNPQEEVI